MECGNHGYKLVFVVGKNIRVFEDLVGKLEPLWDRVKYWVALSVFDTKDF